MSSPGLEGLRGMTEPQIRQREALPYLAIRSEVTNGVPAVVDTAFPQLFAWLGQHAVEPAGPPFIRYLEVDEAGEPLEIEVAAPISDGADPPADDIVCAGILPAGRYATLVHIGPYRHEDVPDLGDAQAALRSWTEQQGMVTGRPSERGSSLAACVEHYRVGPPMEADWTKWETELAYLVVED
jgi:effector-binding domain-containing protein